MGRGPLVLGVVFELALWWFDALATWLVEGDRNHICVVTHADRRMAGLHAIAAGCARAFGCDCWGGHSPS